MSAPDPSLDARIWAYARGEGSHAERKALEQEIGGNPAAARRYATIALMHQRQIAKLETGDAPGSKPPKPAKPSPPARARRAKADRQTAASGVAWLIVACSFLLLFFSSGIYVARGNWSAENLSAARDGVHVAGLLLGSGVILFTKRARTGLLAVSAALVAASSALVVLAAMR